jgi:hypothetical protein
MQEIMIVTAIKKNKYIIGIFIILFSCVIFLFIEKRKENIYIFYKGKPSNCFNVYKYDKEKYYTFCKGEKSIFFQKVGEKIIVDNNSIKILSEELLFKRFGEFGSARNVNFYIIKAEIADEKTEIIPVKKAEFWY